MLMNVEMGPVSSGLLIGWTLASWFGHFMQKVYGMPVDIFEYFRKEDDNAELPVKP